MWFPNHIRRKKACSWRLICRVNMCVGARGCWRICHALNRFCFFAHFLSFVVCAYFQIAQIVFLCAAPEKCAQYEEHYCWRKTAKPAHYAAREKACERGNGVIAFA